MNNRKIYNNHNIRTERDLLDYLLVCFIGYFSLDEIEMIFNFIKKEIL